MHQPKIRNHNNSGAANSIINGKQNNKYANMARIDVSESGRSIGPLGIKKAE